MEFEYDPRKSASTKKKNGLDFEEAQRLWEDPNRVVVPARSQTEERYALVAKIKASIWTCLIRIS